MVSNLSRVQDDILLAIMRRLEARDVLALRQCCKTIARVSFAKQLWLDILNRDVPPHALAPYIKTPSRSKLSNRETEVFALHALRLNTSGRAPPGPRASYALPRARSVTWVRLVRGTWVLVASSDSGSSVLSLFALRDILVSTDALGACAEESSSSSSSSGDFRADSHTDSEHATVTSETNPSTRSESGITYKTVSSNSLPRAEVFLNGPVSDAKVEVRKSDVIVALDIRSSEPQIKVVSIRGLTTDSEPATIVELASFPGLSRIRCLSGAFVGFALREERSIPCIVNWKTGVVSELRAQPDPAGGCVAMTIRRNVVLTASHRIVELYRFDEDADADPGPAVMSIRQFTLGEFPLCKADFAWVKRASHPVSESTDTARTPTLTPNIDTVRLICATSGFLTLYELQIPSLADSEMSDASISEVCSYDPPEYADFISPSFGVTASSVSWLHARSKRFEPVAFETTWFKFPLACYSDAPSEALGTSATYSLSDTHMPALYCLGVRDYDETRGILALGNGFGELSIFDFSGSDPVQLEACFTEIAGTPPLESGVPMPTEPVPSQAYSPSSWPCSGPLFPTTQKDTIIATWRTHQPDPPPAGWSTDFTTDDVFVTRVRTNRPFIRFVPTMEGTARNYETGCQIFGTPVPLVRRKERVDSHFHIIIARIGGLFVVFQDEIGRVSVVSPGISLLDLVAAIDHGRWGDIEMTEVSPDDSAWSEIQRFVVMWKWEWATCGRNRWQEMKDRGGEVDSCWTDGERPTRRREYYAIGNVYVEPGEM